MIANGLTASRILFSLAMLALPSHSLSFSVLYLLCGVTDVLDGFAARRLHTESEKGARLDSAADLFFALAYAVKVLPLLSVPCLIWGWTAIIAAVKVAGIVLASRKACGPVLAHSFGNRLTGVLLFLLPVTVCFSATKYGLILVCVTATLTACAEVEQSLRAPAVHKLKGRNDL